MVRLSTGVLLVPVLIVLASAASAWQNYYCQLCWKNTCNLYCRFQWCQNVCGNQMNNQVCYQSCGYAPPTTTTTTTAPPTPIHQQRCGVSNVGRIVGGRVAEECEFPWAVVVHVGNSLCGGSILNSNTVLTAGHCVYSRSGGMANANTITVRHGSSSQQKMKDVYVQRVYIHPGFVLRYYDYDVAVLKLSRNLTFDRCTQPICLPSVNADPLNTEGCLTAGWGVLDFNIRQEQDRLQKVSLPIVSLADCQKAYNNPSNNYRQVTDIKICAGDLQNGGIDSCLGDSGGPFMCYSQGAYYVYGVVSFGSGCARPGLPGVYSRVTQSNINAWVRSQL